MADSAAGTSMRKRDDYRSLKGGEKAAMLLLSLSEDQSAKLFHMMDDEEIREISQAMAGLGTITADMLEQLFLEFTEQFSSGGSLVGTYESTERLLTRIMDGGKVTNIMEDIRGPAGRTMWDKLGNVNENILANYLKNEYPQTVAVILSKIKPDHAASVLGVLPESFAMEVINRMLKMEAVQKEVLNDIEKTLRTEFMSNLSRAQRRDPHEMMAEIFNGFDRTTEGRFMASLEEVEIDSAEKIKALMFTFDDLNRLDATGMQVVLKNADKDKIGFAMKGASEEIQELFFGNMSERAAKILKDDMEMMGPIKLKDVEDAQTYIVNLAKDLSDRGELEISDNNGDELIY